MDDRSTADTTDKWWIQAASCVPVGYEILRSGISQVGDIFWDNFVERWDVEHPLEDEGGDAAFVTADIAWRLKYALEILKNET